MTSEQLHEQLAACKAALEANRELLSEMLRVGHDKWNGFEPHILLKQTHDALYGLAAAADETPPASGVAGDGPISAAASNDRIAELEQALRESTELMQTVLASNATTGWRYLRGRIAANERLLGGNKNG